MKKILLIFCIIWTSLFFISCSTDNLTNNNSQNVEESTKWKDRMASLEKAQGLRVIIFQNYISFDESVKDFKEFGERPIEEEIIISGSKMKAYPIKNLNNIWTKKSSDTIITIDKLGNKKTINSQDLNNAYISILEDGNGILKTNNIEIKDIKYLITENKEALLFVEPEETIPVKDVFNTLGFEACTNIYVTASDGYWCFTDNLTETENSEIRGTLSGAVNCNLAVEGKGGAGKVNDLFYIDIIE